MKVGVYILNCLLLFGQPEVFKLIQVDGLGGDIEI